MRLEIGVVLARSFFPHFSSMDSKTVQRSALCRSRRELSNEYLLAKIGVDTAENEPVEVWGKNSIQYSIVSLVFSLFSVRRRSLKYVRSNFSGPRRCVCGLVVARVCFFGTHPTRAARYWCSCGVCVGLRLRTYVARCLFLGVPFS